MANYCGNRRQGTKTEEAAEPTMQNAAEKKLHKEKRRDNKERGGRATWL